MSEANVTYTVFLHLTAEPAWLALPRHERRDIIATHIAPLLAKHAPVTTAQWFDAEAFSAAPTDIAMVTTSDLRDWYHLSEELRDTPLWSVPYFRVDQVITAIPDGYADFERDQAGPVRTR